MNQNLGFVKLFDEWKEILPLLFVFEAGQEKGVTIGEEALDDLE